MKRKKTPKMLIEVWKMKEKVYDEIKDLNCEELFRFLNEKTDFIVKKSKRSQPIT